MARSTRNALGRWSPMSPCASQLLLEPESMSSTTRTPRSTSRRAIRHWYPNEVVSPSLIPYEARVVLASRAVSSASGRLAHHAAGDVERGDPGRRSRSSSGRAAAWRAFTSRSMICSSSFNVTGRSGGRRSGIGSFPGTMRTPW